MNCDPSADAPPPSSRQRPRAPRRQGFPGQPLNSSQPPRRGRSPPAGSAGVRCGQVSRVVVRSTDAFWYRLNGIPPPAAAPDQFLFLRN